FFFFPLISVPYLFWVIHYEGIEKPDYLKETYSTPQLMWLVRIFMMVVISAMYSIVLIVLAGALALASKLIIGV
ncbi:MAG: hypothetical protein M1510_11480, partial [Nitrospirae bacterium]|nr:hypothetical protein [Nitrospirota bacterium]